MQVVSESAVRGRFRGRDTNPRLTCRDGEAAAQEQLTPWAVVGGLVSCPRNILHLQKLEDAGLVTSKLELSQDGKALNYFEVTQFAFHLTPEAIADAAKTLSAKHET